MLKIRKIPLFLCIHHLSKHTLDNFKLNKIARKSVTKQDKKLLTEEILSMENLNSILSDHLVTLRTKN